MRIRLRNPNKPDDQFKKFKTMKARLKRAKRFNMLIICLWSVREIVTYNKEIIEVFDNLLSII